MHVNMQNLNTVVPLRFAGESDNRSPPPRRDTYVQTSVVDHGRQSTPAIRPAASRPSTITPITSGGRPCTMVTASSSATMVMSSPAPIQRDGHVEGRLEVVTSAIPILDSWGLPQHLLVLILGRTR